ncbi:hypothetical protein KCV06_g689, partial [Aureobasidium melanogenum]
MKFYLLFVVSAALNFQPALGVDVATWQVDFWQGESCTSDATGSMTGPTHLESGTVCHPIPDIGLTSALDLYAGSTRISLGLHESSDCSDDGGFYESESSSAPECIPIGNAVAYSITTKGKKRSTAVSSSGRSKSSPLEKRIKCHNPNFVLGTGVAATMFWYQSGGVCPLTANEGNINNAQCGLSITFGAVFALIGIFAASGLVNFGKRDLNGTVAPLLEDLTILDGYAVSIRPVGSDLGHPYPAGLDWNNYSFEATNLDGSGANLSSVFSIHSSGRRRLTMPLEEEEGSGPNKRSSKYVAYYGWTDGDTEAFVNDHICKTKDASMPAAEAIWNLDLRATFSLMVILPFLTAHSQTMQANAEKPTMGTSDILSTFVTNSTCPMRRRNLGTACSHVRPAKYAFQIWSPQDPSCKLIRLVQFGLVTVELHLSCPRATANTTPPPIWERRYQFL